MLMRGTWRQVVLVSLDEEEAKYKEYLSEMPWISVPLEDKKRRNLLMTEFEVRSLPTLLLLDEDRKLITARGREFATKDPEGLKFPWRPEPLNEVSYSVRRGRDA
jgi:nucleoredoxin